MSVIDTFECVAKADADLGAIGYGFFGTISPVVGRPHLVVLRKSDGWNPFGTELLWVDHETETIRLFAECSYIMPDFPEAINGTAKPGDIANIRTFWGAGDNRPGIVWLPRWFVTTPTMEYRTTGKLVENAILASGAPYRPDGTRLLPGQWQEAVVDADTVVAYLGVTTQLGEEATVIRRLDVMGDRTKPETRNREEYEIGYGRGSYGYIRWASWDLGVKKHEQRSTSVQPVSGPCRFYGVDPLDPELRERWMMTPGYDKPLPEPGAPTRRPTQPKKKRASWIERMGL